MVVAAPAPTNVTKRNRGLHASPHLVPVLECVLSDRLACAELVARRNQVAIAAAATAAAMNSHDMPSQTTSNINTSRHSRTPFHALREPSVTPVDYLHRLVRHSHCSRAVFITAIIYLDRAAARRPELRLNGLNIHRLLLTAVLLATKYHDDILYDNAHFAFVGGLDVPELNHLELTLAKVLDWRLHVSASEFADYEARLVHAVMASPNSAFDALRCSLVNLVTPLPVEQNKNSNINKHRGLPPNSPVSVSEGSKHVAE